MPFRPWMTVPAIMLFVFVIAACGPSFYVPPLTPIPTLAPGVAPTLAPAIATPQLPLPSAGAADVAAGAAIFARNCSRCHGLQGEGTDIAPALRNNPLITSGDQAVFRKIADGVTDTAMPAWAQSQGGPLTTDDVYNVMAYLKILQNVPQLPRGVALPLPPTPTPIAEGAPTPQPIRPSMPGGTGEALKLTGDPHRGTALFGRYCAGCHGPQGRFGQPNPGSNQGVVPALNPINPLLVSRDSGVFAANIDLFLEHGSIPAGSAPQLTMPAYGDLKLLAPQQIADLIAYIISLNRR